MHALTVRSRIRCSCLMRMTFYLCSLGRMLFSLETQQVRGGEFCHRDGRLGGRGLLEEFLEVMWCDLRLT